MECMRKLFPFRPLDYRAAEEWLNMQAEQGWELTHISMFSIAHFKRAQSPRRYAVTLWQTSTNKEKLEELNEFEAFLATFGWEYRSSKGQLHIFEADASQPSLTSDPVAEAMQIKKQYWSNILGGIIATAVICLVGFLQSLSRSALTLLLGRPLGLLGLLVFCAIVIYCIIQLQAFARFAYASRKARKEGSALFVRTQKAAWRNGVLYWIMNALFFAISATALTIDALEDISHVSTIFYVLAVSLASFLGSAIRSLMQRHSKTRKVHIAALIVLTVLVFIGRFNTMELQNKNVADFKGLPVLHVATEKASNNILYHCWTPIMSVYKFQDFSSNYGYRFSLCVDSATDALAGRVFHEAAYEYSLWTNWRPSLTSTFEAYAMPGADYALINREGHFLVIHHHRRVVRLDWRDPADTLMLYDPAFAAYIAEIFFS